jgi:hypothetical protein
MVSRFKVTASGWRIGAYLGRVKRITKAQQALRSLLDELHREGELERYYTEKTITVPPEAFKQTGLPTPKRPIPYSVDYLLCPKNPRLNLLIVEVDGASHLSRRRREKDEIRDKVIQSWLGIPTLRIPDSEVKKKNFPELRKKIIWALEGSRWCS